MSDALLSALRRRGGAAPEWAPTDLAGLTFWLEARAGDLWEDTGKTLPVVDLDPVRVWTPRDPTTDLVAPSDGARPTYRETGLGGTARGVLFDRTDDYVRSDTAGLTGAQTWILRWAWDGAAAPRVLFGQVCAGPTNNELWVRTGAQLRIHFGQTASAAASVYAAVSSLGTGAHTTVITWDGVSPSSGYTVTHDGSACSISAGATTTRPTASTSARTTLGARNDDTASSFWGGHIGLVLVVDGVLTGTDLTSAVAYADGWV